MILCHEAGWNIRILSAGKEWLGDNLVHQIILQACSIMNHRSLLPKRLDHVGRRNDRYRYFDGRKESIVIDSPLWFKPVPDANLYPSFIPCNSCQNDAYDTDRLNCPALARVRSCLVRGDERANARIGNHTTTIPLASLTGIRLMIAHSAWENGWEIPNGKSANSVWRGNEISIPSR